ncbi:hypothetical protein JKP88DRAFT_252636 [Tribonema minus]|uniref:EF-hand domain-containing protein n=1 Tax=Tribonema minus TaxID=303371 RepID=A0A836CKG4_9STRA|nr:hypothetical protein JKP88DRAFT_252636 [Tribonema minus]
MWPSSVLAGKSALEIRGMNRACFRLEQTQPGAQWMAFREQRHKDERMAARYARAHAGLDKKPITPTVELFLKRLRLVLHKLMKKKGGSAFSIIRNACLKWDLDNSGAIAVEELLGACRSIGVPITRQEAEEVVYCYDARDTVIIAFRAKLKDLLARRIREQGGSEMGILKALFLKWNTSRSFATSADDVRGALRKLGMNLTRSQADEVVGYYTPRSAAAQARMCASAYCDNGGGGSSGGNGGAAAAAAAAALDAASYFDFRELIHDIVKGERSILAFPSQEEMEAVQREGLVQETHRECLNDMAFTARPVRKPRNREVEKFKLRLRDRLELIIEHRGGIHHAREMDYTLLCREIEGMSHDILSYVEDCDVLRGLDHAVREPPLNAEVRAYVRGGVERAAARAAATAGAAGAAIAPRDLFLGTCLRFDAGSTGMVDGAGLRRVCSELGVALKLAEADKMCMWYELGLTLTPTLIWALDLTLTLGVRHVRAALRGVTISVPRYYHADVRVACTTSAPLSYPIVQMCAWYEHGGRAAFPYKELTDDMFGPAVSTAPAAAAVATRLSAAAAAAALRRHHSATAASNKRAAAAAAAAAAGSVLPQLSGGSARRAVAASPNPSCDKSRPRRHNVGGGAAMGAAAGGAAAATAGASVADIERKRAQLQKRLKELDEARDALVGIKTAQQSAVADCAGA